MKLLVATRQTQGTRKNDFCFCRESELVWFGSECDNHREDIDGPCGCKRSFVGMRTQKATTTMRVVEATLTMDQLVQRGIDSLKRGGWIKPRTKGHELESWRKAVAETFRDIARHCQPFAPGTILERRGYSLRPRHVPGVCAAGKAA